MAAVGKSSKYGYDALSAMRCVVISGLFSAKKTSGKFSKLDPVYIDSDGAVSAAGGSSTVWNYDGFASAASDSDGGTPVTILGKGLIMEWLETSDLWTPGTKFYGSAATAGGLDTTAGAVVAADAFLPVAKAINNKEIIVLR